MFTESTLHRDIANDIASGIIVQQAIETDALHRGYETASRGEGLQTTAGADAHHRQRAMLVVLCASSVVDVGQRIKFVDYDVDIIAANAVRLAGDALAFIRTGDGMELATRYLTLLGVEMGCNRIDTGWIAHEDNLVSQLFWLQVQMETRAVLIDNEL